MIERKRRSRAEQRMIELFEKVGVEFLTKGWPDFLCCYQGKLFCIEVKKTPRESLKRHQRKVIGLLQRHGIRTLRWDPIHGFSEPDCTISGAENLDHDGNSQVRIE